MENVNINKKLNLKSFFISIFICFLVCISFCVSDTKANFLNISNFQNKSIIESSNNALLGDNQTNTNTYESEETINEPSPYSGDDKKEEEKNPYKEDTLHMVYFAVYFVDFVPSSKSEEFTIQKMFLAPQKSSPSMTYDEKKAAYSSTVCKFTYAEKEFYIYDDGAIAHNREYKMKDHYREELIPMPKAEVVSSNSGYRYIGYKYDVRSAFTKYKSTKLLPGAKNLNEIEGTDIKATKKSNGYDNLYNITISFYFYKPSQLILNSHNPEFGRFSNNPESTFDNANERISVTVQEGLNIKVTLFKINTPQIAAQITGTQKFIIDGVEQSREINETYYIILNDYCHIKSRIPYEYMNKKGYNISYYFTQDVFDLSFTINTNISNASNASLFVSYGTLSQRYDLENGTNNNVKITFEDLPAGIKDSLLISLSTGRSDYKYIISQTPVTSVKKTDYYHNIIEVAREIELTKDTELTEIACYVYELYEFTIESRTDEETSLMNREYKINGIDYQLQRESSKKIDGYKFMGYSLEEDSIEIVHTIETNDNLTLYANWKKDISATLYYKESPYGEPTLDFGAKQYIKTIYNFDTDNSITIDSLPTFTSDGLFLGYTKDKNNSSCSLFNVGDKIYDGEIYYGVYQYEFSFRYDISSILDDENVTITGNIPSNIAGILYHVVYGKKEKAPDIIITDQIAFEKTHYDFLGWSEYSGGSIDHSGYYQAGDTLQIYANSHKVLYPIFDRHPYYITVELNGGRFEAKNNNYVYTYDEQANTVTFRTYNDELFYFPYSNLTYYSSILRDGYEISKITALVNPENLTSSNNYKNISADETITIEWKMIKYKVKINLFTAIPNNEPRFDTKVTYSYYDIISNETFNGEHYLNLSNTNFELDVPMGTVINLEASIEADNFNLAFAERSGIKNKTCSYSYTSKGDGNSQNITLFLTFVYEIRLIQKGVTEGNEEEILYKYYDIESLRLPTNIGVKEGYILNYWNTKEDGSGKTLSTIQPRDNQNYTFYAIWTKYVKFYLDNSTESETPKKLSENEVYSGNGYKDHRITKGDITYYLAGYSTSPNSTVIEYDGKSNLTLTNSVSWYAVYYTNELTHTITENVDVKFHLNGSLVEKTVNRSITYSNYKTYFNVDFTVENNNNFDKATITYRNDTLEFIDDTIGEYMIYGWNNSGNYRDGYFTKDDEIIVKTEFDFYPIYRTINYDESKLPHTFYFEVNKPITRYSTIYRLSNNFKVVNYDFSGETQYSDTKTYEPIYDSLEFDSLSNQNPNAFYTRYSLYGWGISQYALYPKWQSGKIEVTESTTWYAVWKLTDEETRTETLTHTFHINENKFITKNTTKVEKVRNKITIMSCDRQFKDVISDGDIYSTAYTNLEYLDLINENSSFYGWSTSPDSTNQVFGLFNESSFRPTENTSLYPIYYMNFILNIVYACEGRENEIKTKMVPVYTNHDSSVITVLSTESSYYKYIVEDIEWTINNNNFLGWSFAINDDFSEDNNEDDNENLEDNENNDDGTENQNIYFAGDEVIIENITEETTFTLYAILKQPDIIKVTININNEEIEKDCLEGDLFELITPEEIEGKEFKHWSVNNKIYSPGETITLTANTEIIAIYKGDNDNNDKDNNNNNNPNNGSKIGIIIATIIVSCVVIAGITVICVIIIKKKNKVKTKK